MVCFKISVLNVFQKYESNNVDKLDRVCRAIQVDILVSDWERQVKDYKKLLKHLQVKIPKKSDDLVPKRCEGAAIGALQEAAKAYIVSELGNFFKKNK